MAKQQITGLEIRPVQAKGRRGKMDEQLRMDVPGGAVFLRRSTLEAAGGSWSSLHRRLAALAETHNIPFAEYTAEQTK